MVFGPFTLNLDQVVASEEKFGDVSTIIMSQVELSTWMNPLVAVQIENKIVKDNKSQACFNRDVNLFWREGLDLSSSYHFRGLYMAKRELIADSVDCLSDNHHEDKGEKASKPKEHSFIS